MCGLPIIYIALQFLQNAEQGVAKVQLKIKGGLMRRFCPTNCINVWESVLLLRGFTISQLVRATGLSPEIVRAEVQWLGQEGFVVSQHGEEQDEDLYSLSDDPEIRLELSRSLDRSCPSSPKPSHPTARLYHAALHTLSQAEKARGQQREELLAQAAHQLEGAWHAEGGSRAPDLVQAHILRERGRLAYLQGADPDLAHQLLS